MDKTSFGLLGSPKVRDVAHRQPAFPSRMYSPWRAEDSESDVPAVEFELGAVSVTHTSGVAIKRLWLELDPSGKWYDLYNIYIYTL